MSFKQAVRHHAMKIAIATGDMPNLNLIWRTRWVKDEMMLLGSILTEN